MYNINIIRYITNNVTKNVMSIFVDQPKMSAIDKNSILKL